MCGLRGAAPAVCGSRAAAEVLSGLLAWAGAESARAWRKAEALERLAVLVDEGQRTGEIYAHGGRRQAVAEVAETFGNALNPSVDRRQTAVASAAKTIAEALGKPEQSSSMRRRIAEGRSLARTGAVAEAWAELRGAT